MPTCSTPRPPATANSESGGGPVEVEPRVRVVLDDEHAPPSGDLDDLGAPRGGHGRAARVVVRRDEVDELRHRALGGEAVERVGERVGAHPVLVLRDGGDARAARAEGADGAGVGGRARQRRVAGAEEGRGDVVDGVRAAGAERDVGGAKREPARLGLAVGDPGAERLEALRAAVGERARRVVAQRARDGVGDGVDGQRCGVGHAGVEVVGEGGERGRRREVGHERPEQPLVAGLAGKRGVLGAHDAASLRRGA